MGLCGAGRALWGSVGPGGAHEDRRGVWGSMGVCVGVYRGVWGCVGLWGGLWGPMGVYGPLWGYVRDTGTRMGSPGHMWHTESVTYATRVWLQGGAIGPWGGTHTHTHAHKHGLTRM